MPAIIRTLRLEGAMNRAPWRPVVLPNLRVIPKPPKKAAYQVKTTVKITPFIGVNFETGEWSTAPTTLKRIVQAVCSAWGVTEIEIRSTRRNRKYARPRQAAYLLASERLPYSIARIGMLLDRDHSTVLHGIKVAKAETDPEFVAKLAEARGKLEVDAV